MTNLAANTKSQLETLHKRIGSITHTLHALLQTQMARKQNHADLLSGLQKLPAVLAEMQASMKMVNDHGVVPKGFGKMTHAISDIRKKIERASRASIAAKKATPAFFSNTEGIKVQERLLQGISKRVEEVPPHITKTLKKVFWKEGPETADMNTALESADTSKLQLEEKSVAKLAANKKMSQEDIEIRETALSHETRRNIFSRSTEMTSRRRGLHVGLVRTRNSLAWTRNRRSWTPKRFPRTNPTSSIGRTTS